MKTPTVGRRDFFSFSYGIRVAAFILTASVLAFSSFSVRSGALIETGAPTESPQSQSIPNSNVISRFSNAFFLPQAAPPAIATFESTCQTADSDFNLGETVCGHATSTGGSASGRRITWVDPQGFVRKTTPITDDTQDDTFAIPGDPTTVLSNGQEVSNIGNWRVNIVTSRGALVTYAVFVVKDPANAQASLAIFKRAPSDAERLAAGSVGTFEIQIENYGPDNAQNVVVTDRVPNNTTFVAMLQTSLTPNPGFTCDTVPDANGDVRCTISSLASGATASFDFAFRINEGTPTGTLITNTATISSATADGNNLDNSSSASITVAGGGGGTGTCTLDCPPNINTEANTTDQNNNPGAIIHFDQPTTTGTCGTITADHCNDCFFPVGTTVVTFSSTTGDSCSFAVTVSPPNTGAVTISCPADQSATADSNCQGNVAVGTATATGNNVTVIGFRSDGRPLYDCDANGTNCTRRATDDPFAAGFTTITWFAYSHDVPGPYTSAEDEEAHRTGSASCTQTISVTDVTPPSISPPPGQTASADASCMAPVPDFTTSATVSDNCACAQSDNSPGCEERGRIAVTQEPAPGTMVGLGTHTITLTANDGSSNNDGAGNSATTTTTFTVNDTTAPVVTCPANIELPSLPGTCNASVSPGVATATDNCDGNVVPTPSRSDGRPITDPFPVGNTTITWTATDAAGNSSSCDQTVVVLDNENPQITCPDNITTNTDPGECTATVDPGTPTATDNCSEGAPPPTVSGSRSDGQALNAPYPKGTTTITWTATDSSGNTASCEQTVTVNDAEDPLISCPANITRGTDSGTCVATIDPGTATATDNCGSATVNGTRSDNQPLNAPYPKGTTTITWTATDSSGNDASCTQTITVNDTEAPAISCPANITTGTDPGTCAANVNPGTATATDNCDASPTVSGTRSDGQALNAPYPQGTTTITWTATDDDGNSSSCMQTVTVVDDEAPVITFNGVTPSMWPPNHNYRTFTNADFISSVSDNCDSLSVNDVYITKVTSDEAEESLTLGDGTTFNDMVIAADCKSVQLRAERVNSGNGRVYTIHFKLVDSSGNITTGTAKVHSPKNQNNGTVDDGPVYTVTSSCP